MKANWKIALMCFATLAMVMACNKKDEPKPSGGDDEPEGEFVSKVSVTDNSIAEWANLPAEFVAEAKCPADAALLGLKSVKVYADQLYINILVEPNMDDIVDKEWVPFHVYINTDNSDKTGGYGDQFLDANSDILLETAVFGEGEPISYNPAVFKWWGEVGGSGWEWTDPEVEGTAENGWGALVAEGALPVGASQFVDGKFEIQIMREVIPCENFAPWAEEFGIGFDIQQNWSSVGILPLVSPTDADPNGHAKKLQVKIDMSK
ncbi:MAG: hypothetical protein J5612_00035 [Paludibacteraceae bacterium]|nr:hypothetical protein [Paludibacteraceae bacterium]